MFYVYWCSFSLLSTRCPSNRWCCDHLAQWDEFQWMGGWWEAFTGSLCVCRDPEPTELNENEELWWDKLSDEVLMSRWSSCHISHNVEPSSLSSSLTDVLMVIIPWLSSRWETKTALRAAPGLSVHVGMRIWVLLPLRRPQILIRRFKADKSRQTSAQNVWSTMNCTAMISIERCQTQNLSSIKKISSHKLHTVNAFCDS